MAALPENVKVYVVQKLACFEPLHVVVKAVKDDFGIEVSKQALQAYDPNKSQGSRLSAKLKDIFNSTRKKFLEDTSTIPISHKAVRLTMLQRMADQAESSRNIVLAASLIEQAAKEVGDSFTNKQKIEHAGEIRTPTTITRVIVKPKPQNE